jgi:hypothetical protein
VWDYIKGLFDAPFSTTENGLGIIGLSVVALVALWVLCGFFGALRDIAGDLKRKASNRRTDEGGGD